MYNMDDVLEYNHPVVFLEPSDMKAFPSIEEEYYTAAQTLTFTPPLGMSEIQQWLTMNVHKFLQIVLPNLTTIRFNHLFPRRGQCTKNNVILLNMEYMFYLAYQAHTARFECPNFDDAIFVKPMQLFLQNAHIPLSRERRRSVRLETLELVDVCSKCNHDFGSEEPSISCTPLQARRLVQYR